MTPLLLALVGSVLAVPLEVPRWQAAIDRTQGLVVREDPAAIQQLEVLRQQEVVDGQGNIYPVEDTMLGLLARELEDRHAGARTAAGATSAAARHLALLRSEAARLGTFPPPPFSPALRTTPGLPVTAPPISVDRPSRLEPDLFNAFVIIREWLQVSSHRGWRGAGATGGLLLALGLLLLVIAVSPLFSRTPPAIIPRDAASAPSPRVSPLGARLLEILTRLEGAYLHSPPQHITNGEVMRHLARPLTQPPQRPLGQVLSPAIEVHNQVCYGERPPTDQDLRVLEQAAAAVDTVTRSQQTSPGEPIETWTPPVTDPREPS